MSTMTLAERRETLVNSLRASKSWTTGYAEAFVDDYVISTQPAQAVDVGAIRDVIEQMRKASAQRAMPPHYEAGCYMAWIDDLTRAISGEKAGLADEWEAAFHAQRAAAMRSHTVCYETMLARPDVAELGDDGRLHDAIHDILRVDGPASPAPDKEG